MLSALFDVALLEGVVASLLVPAHSLTVEEARGVFDYDAVAEDALLFVVFGLQVLEILWHLEQVEFEIGSHQ